MNRITLAVKSALGLALLAPPAMVFAQAANGDSSALEEVVVTGIRGSVEKSLEAKREADIVSGGHHRRRHRQDARQERGRFAAARSRRDHQLRRRQRRRLRRERSRQHARHQPQPHPDPDQRPRRRLGRLVRAQPGAPWAAASATPCCRPSWSARSSCTRARRPTSSKAASPAPSTSSRASRSISRQPHPQGSLGAVYADLPDEDRRAVQRCSQLEERSEHLRRAGAGLLEDAAPAPRRPGMLGYEQIAPGSPVAMSQPGSRRRLVPGADRLGVLRAGARAQRRTDRLPGQARRTTSSFDLQRLRLEAGGLQLQPQLSALAAAFLATGGTGGQAAPLPATWSATTPWSSATSRRHRRALRRLRPDLASGRKRVPRTSSPSTATGAPATP